ncbi:Methyltransferase FkbM [Candidatus Nanopelagicaceae bacterium]
MKPVRSGHELIRLGGLNDGGYLIPNVLEGVTACFSPGVSTNSSFEWDLAELGVKCYLADYSVQGPPQDHPNFDFVKKYLDSVTSPTSITLSSWLEEKPVTGDLILQMDIEGFEYAVISSTSSATLNQFRIIVLELHEFDSIVTSIGNWTVKNLLNRLLENHSIVHIHPNNYGNPRKFFDKLLPRGIELTFLRNDFVNGSGFVEDFPNLLDQPNSLIYPDFELDVKWFS